jgi:hypothetical protein
MTTIKEQEVEKSILLKNNYDCDVIVSENTPYTLYNAADIGKILGFGNIRSIIREFDENEKVKISKKTKGGNQDISYITYQSLEKILLKSRKPESIELSKLLEIDKKTKYYTCIETDIIQCLLTTFDGNIMIPQYRIDNYRIDLYFPEYLLAIECDEIHHDTAKSKEDDAIRTIYLTKKLGCRFIRCKPFEKNFNLFKLLNNIYIHLSVFPKEKIQENCF